MKEYFNYHRHTHSSNISTIDCTVNNEDYAKRSIALGHKWISSCEHGGAINWVDTYMTAKKNDLKYVHCGEYYFVPDRIISSEKERLVPIGSFQGYSSDEKVLSKSNTKDNSNYHLILIAKTKKAFEEMNYIMSEANTNGYYYKARIDFDLLRRLPKGEVYCTTACIGGFLRDYEKNEWILKEMIEIFGENLLLEVQPHKSEKQIEYNKLIKKLSKEYGLKMIGANDSHMIDEKGKIDRDYLLHSKGLIYEDEGEWYLDYPSYEVMEERFLSQGIWEKSEVLELMNNTLMLTEGDVLSVDTKMKVPTIYKDKNREWKLSKLKERIFESWEKYKNEVDESLHGEYISEILEEYSVIEETKMEDYFLTNMEIISKGIEYGGVLTKTGRGSATSYITNMLFGFTTVDRLKSKVPMLRERFMGKARIIDNNSAPDIDFNVYNREAFEKAQSELLGESCSYPMVAHGTLGLKSAFKMLCRAKNIPIDVADEISKIISTYQHDKKYDENVNIEDYFNDDEHISLIKESAYYNGIIDSFSVHPCSYLLSNSDIKRSFGLIKTPNGTIVANVTGTQAEKLGYLKNDLLIVTVVGMNDALYKRIEIEQPESNELYDWVTGDDKVWGLYEKGHTQCLNQMESQGTTSKTMRYKPKTVEELCNMVAIIRPSCRSIYPIFEQRKEFSYGIADLDKLLQGEFLDTSLIIYQEQIMELLKWLGIPDSEGYAIMKAISKKKLEVIETVKERFEEKLMEAIIKDMLEKGEI
ncbi:MAG: PHP domain-containing protein [Cetobacterium sp.]